MTTIAWDGITLAADDQATTGVRKSFGEKKVHRAPDGVAIYGARVMLMGFSGTSGDERHLIQYITEGKCSSQAEMHEQIECTAILVTEDNRCFSVQKSADKKLPWIYEKKAPYAIGSGADFAITAMHLGKDAVEAVIVASKLDAYTGSTVHCYKLNDSA